MDRPNEFKTRRGIRVFRQTYTHAGEVRHAENYSIKVKRNGRVYYFNLGKDKKAAEKTANEIGAFLAVKSNGIEEALQLFAPEKHPTAPKPGEKHVPTVKEFCDRYKETAVHLSRSTIQNNTCAIHRISAHILGLSAHGKSMPRLTLKKWRQKVEAMPMSRLCGEQLLSFRNSMIRAAGTDELARGRAITTSNSYIRCASSMFSSKWRLCYRDFTLPEPNPFSEVSRLPEPSHRYHSAVDATLLVEEAKNELQNSDPEAYLVFTLALFCGMRRKEIDRLRWEQIDVKNNHIWICVTADNKPKTSNSESRIDAGPEVFRLLEEFRPRSITPPYVLPGSLKVGVRYRCKPIYDRLIAWLKQKGMPPMRTLHSLRKEAGSLMFAQSGSIDVTAEFLRNDPRVAREHYIGRKGRLELKLVQQPAERTVAAA